MDVDFVVVVVVAIFVVVVVVTTPTQLQPQHNLTFLNFSWVKHENGSAHHH